MERFLITTADEESWSDGQPVLFLGEWCRLFERRERWRAMDAEVLPYHWEDAGKFARDYDYLIDFYERLLAALGGKLNSIHGVAYDTRYWRILLGPWLALFTQILFDRWECIHRAVRDYRISGTIVLKRGTGELLPNDMQHFSQLMTRDDWNHQIYADVLKHATDVPCEERTTLRNFVPTAPAKPGLRKRLVAACSRLASLAVRDDDVLLVDTYLPYIDEIRLYLKLGQLPQRWRPLVPVRAQADRRQRNFTIPLRSNSAFETFALALVPRQIPVLFLEGYGKLIEQVRTLPWPARPKMVFSSNVLFHNTVAMAYTAANVARGTHLAYGQHGGNYWITELHWGESHEVAIADTFFSWGYEDKSQPKIRAVGYFKARYPAPAALAKRTRLLLITQCSPRYSYSLFSGPKARQTLDRYLNGMFSFVDTLAPACRESTLVRLTQADYGWGFFERWRERFPQLGLDAGILKMKKIVAESRIVVCSYRSTAFFETLASDFPTMIFWDPAIEPLAKSAIPYYDLLERVGIFHTTPESAARHVSKIWDHIDAWWITPPVRAALEVFKARYCKLPDDRVTSIAAGLRKALAAPPS